MKQIVEIKGRKVNIIQCLTFQRDLERIIDYTKDFDLINDSNYSEELEKIKKDLNSFIDNNFKEVKDNG